MIKSQIYTHQSSSPAPESHHTRRSERVLRFFPPLIWADFGIEELLNIYGTNYATHECSAMLWEKRD